MAPANGRDNQAAQQIDKYRYRETQNRDPVASGVWVRQGRQTDVEEEVQVKRKEGGREKETTCKRTTRRDSGLFLPLWLECVRPLNAMAGYWEG